ncbi:Protein of unknown function [Andreprevotia lacus DSM 23236]|jgi:hypothetical protein|uniref:Lipoprotein n=1 Tax=Andreprevotia lacus DSM 23236 TaxID=1121001 RepID=A0A1W1XQA6_9NEIS|nr:DUF3833 domain-containing protein [Andreprevotia lacus]SMC26153.1 Protein of unknown function [Andreprevotia lacus DSM 23236]
MKPKWMLSACALLLGCAGPDVQHYRNEQPVFDPVRYFSGKTEGWGMFQKRSGEVVKRFHVQIAGRSEQGRLILDEHFVYSDGSTQQRVWTLSRQPDGSWRGTAGDVVGEAVGQLAGNALHWRYTLRLPVDDNVYDVQMDDWMYLQDDTTLINRTSMSKLGFELGQVTLFFRKLQ